MNYQEIKQIENTHYVDVFGRLDVCFTKGRGTTLIEKRGKHYSDFLSGIAVNALGYSDAGFKRALKKQTDKLLHTGNYFYIESQSELVKALVAATGYDRVFIANSGAEAVEAAIKLARKYFYDKGENKTEIITMDGSFHGRTLATLAATGQSKFHEAYKPLLEGFKYVPFQKIGALKEAITDKTCAVLIEPVQGEGGVMPAGEVYYQTVRQICDEAGILMIADEIQTGIGRCGQFLASQVYGVKPDIVCLAKSLGNGLPIGAMLATENTAQAFKTGDHGSTFGGNHLVCAGAAYVVKKISDEKFLAGVRSISEYFMRKLEPLERFPQVESVRGLGLMLAVAFYEGFSAKNYQKALLDAGFVAATAGQNTLRFLPPYIVKKKQIDELVNALETILTGEK